MSYSQYWVNRGNPWDHDDGPPKNLKWPRLFSETPNYRQLSKTALGFEKFRWHFGPVYYRGRLRAGKVKVLIIGQEGGQDESLAHRAFVGMSGAHMQHFLRFLGIDYSYLFMNTFVYSIFDQYSGIKWLAQNPESPIVKHRHEILNYVLDKNDVDLVVAVGTAAKETIETWVESRGGTCPDGTGDLSSCTANVLGSKTQIVGLMHPGGAAFGNIVNVTRSFQTAVDRIRNWAQDPTWLIPDPGMSRDLTLPYAFDAAEIPFRDLPFGTTWRLGHGDTGSKRKGDQAIQLFSANGNKNNQGHRISYSDSVNGTSTGYSEEPGDVPYEPQVYDYKGYDKGPGSSFARLFMGGVSGKAWPDFNTLGATVHPSLGFGPIYRGRAKNARMLILADQESQDDIFMARALTGNGGQHIQAFIRALGVSTSYCIIRSLPVDTLDLSVSERRDIVQDARVLKVYREIVKRILRRNHTEVILTFGSVAETLMSECDAMGIPVVNLKSWRQSRAKADWQAAIPVIRALNPTSEVVPTWTYDGERLQIPGYDLSYGTLKWQASSGDRGYRAKKQNGDWSPDYYKLFAPGWVFNQEPRPLSVDEQRALENHP